MSAQKLRLCLIMLLLVASQPLFPQCNIEGITSDLTEDLRYVVRNYLDEVEVSTNLNRGTLYVKKFPTGEHPFLLINEWTIGSLNYDNIFYPEVKLKYDLVKDQLVSQNSLGVTFSLQKAKVGSFKIFEKTFVQIDNHNDSDQFFELKECGGVSLLVKLKKHFKEIREYPKVRFVYDQEEEYYLYKSDSLFQLTGKKSILKFFEDHKVEVAAFAKGLGRFTRENRGEYYADLTAFYNKLNQRQ